MKKVLVRFNKRQRGATAIEYALIVGLVALGIAAGATQLGSDISSGFSSLGTTVKNLMAGFAPSKT
ncbi:MULTISPECIES: Flp family type IVb pilin [unclassified Cupriavidus]|uniref:Flp family type IVb pilin n=1 Tax=Cupriavidus sp. H19C3 TaxID=3241603 RepID=UPI0011D6DE34|nr:MAG: Flp family type IVb pilin [Cupriavidus sp.]